MSGLDGPPNFAGTLLEDCCDSGRGCVEWFAAGLLEIWILFGKFATSLAGTR